MLCFALSYITKLKFSDHIFSFQQTVASPRGLNKDLTCWLNNPPLCFIVLKNKILFFQGYATILLSVKI